MLRWKKENMWANLQNLRGPFKHFNTSPLIYLHVKFFEYFLVIDTRPELIVR